MSLLYALAGGAIALALSLWKAYRVGVNVGEGKSDADKLDSYEATLQDIDRANAARNSVDDRLPVKDKYRRD